MNNKDRIAVVCTLLLVVLSITDADSFIFVTLFLISYWGYRFIKNDISFLKIKDD